MVEYLLIFVLLLGSVAGAAYIVRAITAQSARTDVLLTSDYP